MPIPIQRPSLPPRLWDVWSDEELLASDTDAETPVPAARDSSGSRQRVMLTERDLALFRFLARYRYATYPQIAAYTGASYGSLRHRLPRLAREGLLARGPVGQFKHGVWLPTATAIRLADLDLPAPTLSWATVAHTLGLVDLGVRYEQAGEIVVTEREIRAEDERGRPRGWPGRPPAVRDDLARIGAPRIADDTPPRYVAVLGTGPRAYRHIPDMVLVRPDGSGREPRSVAIELELTHKTQAQWVRIMQAYAATSTLGRIVYWTHKSKIAAGVTRAAAAAGIADRVEVQRFAPDADAVVPLSAAG